MVPPDRGPVEGPARKFSAVEERILLFQDMEERRDAPKYECGAEPQRAEEAGQRRDTEHVEH